MKLAVQTSQTNVSSSGRLTLETDLEEEGFVTHAGFSVAPEDGLRTMLFVSLSALLSILREVEYQTAFLIMILISFKRTRQDRIFKPGSPSLPMFPFYGLKID